MALQDRAAGRFSKPIVHSHAVGGFSSHRSRQVRSPSVCPRGQHTILTCPARPRIYMGSRRTGQRPRRPEVHPYVLIAEGQCRARVCMKVERKVPGPSRARLVALSRTSVPFRSRQPARCPSRWNQVSFVTGNPQFYWRTVQRKEPFGYTPLEFYTTIHCAFNSSVLSMGPHWHVHARPRCKL